MSRACRIPHLALTSDGDAGPSSYRSGHRIQRGDRASARPVLCVSIWSRAVADYYASELAGNPGGSGRDRSNQHIEHATTGSSPARHAAFRAHRDQDTLCLRRNCPRPDARPTMVHPRRLTACCNGGKLVLNRLPTVSRADPDIQGGALAAGVGRCEGAHPQNQPRIANLSTKTDDSGHRRKRVRKARRRRVSWGFGQRGFANRLA